MSTCGGTSKKASISEGCRSSGSFGWKGRVEGSRLGGVGPSTGRRDIFRVFIIAVAKEKNKFRTG